MKETFGKLWKFPNTDVREIITLDNIKSTADSGKAVFGLAKALQDNKSYFEIGQYVNQISTLLDVLNSPWGDIIRATSSFISIGVDLFKFYLHITKTEPSLPQTVALITQSAYLSSLNYYLQTHPDLAEVLEKNEKEVCEQVSKQIDELAQLEIDHKDARFALAFFADSKLAKTFNDILKQRLIHNNIDSKY